METESRTTPEHDVIVERFMRRTIRIGSLVGGVEKTVEYDMKVEKPTVERVRRSNGGADRFPEKTKVEYRKYREAKRENPQEGDLSGLARKQTTFTLTNTDDVSYREFVSADPMYLVSWDEGASVHIMSEEELDDLLRGAGEIPEEETQTTPTDVLANALDRLDTDVPEQPA